MKVKNVLYTSEWRDANPQYLRLALPQRDPLHLFEEELFLLSTAMEHDVFGPWSTTFGM